MTPAMQTDGFDYSAVPEHARALSAAADRVRILIRTTAGNIVDVGNELIHAKERIGHGRFGAWLAAEFGMTDRSARNYMRAAQWAQSNSEIISDLEPTAIYLLAAPSTPPQAKDEVARRIEGGERLSIDGIKTLVKIAKASERDEKRQEVRRAKRRRRRPEEDREAERVRMEAERARVNDAADELVVLLHDRLGEDGCRRFCQLVEEIGFHRSLSCIASDIKNGAP